MSSNDEYREVETSPDGRYVRYDKKLGAGAYKDVYLSVDTDRGEISAVDISFSCRFRTAHHWLGILVLKVLKSCSYWPI